MDVESNLEIKDFEEITGLTLTAAQEELYDSIASRAQVRLERALGWNLKQTDNYEEAGQINDESAVINQDTILERIENEELEEADEVENTWRLFPYWDTDTNLKIDPCTAVYHVKLVVPVKNDDTQFVTLANLKNYYPVVGKASGRNNYITYIQKTAEITNNWHTNGLMLAVDAEWLARNYPNDLKEILADLIIYGYQSRPSLASDSSRVLKSYSESVDGHSVSKTYADVTTSELNAADPLQDANTIFTLKNYIGPYSPLYERQRLY